MSEFKVVRSKGIGKSKKKYISQPWVKYWKWIFSRCNYAYNASFPDYGAKGIKCLITIPELKELWFRDKAAEMKKPSIDRIDPKKNYEFSNCRFLELSENIARGKRKYEKKDRPVTEGTQQEGL